MATHDDAPRPEKPRRAVVTDGSVAVEVVPLDALTPLADNPRTHTSRGIDVITASLDRVGAARSGVIDEARTILVGNGLHEAAAQAGYREALVVTTDGTRPVFVRRTGLSPTQKAPPHRRRQPGQRAQQVEPHAGRIRRAGPLCLPKTSYARFA